MPHCTTASSRILPSTYVGYRIHAEPQCECYPISHRLSLTNSVSSLLCARRSTPPTWTTRAIQPTRRHRKNASPMNSNISDLRFNPLFSLRFTVVKAHHATVTAKEREILAREQTLPRNEQRLTSLLHRKGPRSYVPPKTCRRSNNKFSRQGMESPLRRLLCDEKKSYAS